MHNDNLLGNNRDELFEMDQISIRLLLQICLLLCGLGNNWCRREQQMTEPSDAETICQLRSEIGQLKYQLEKQAADNAEVLRFWQFDPSGNPKKIAQQWYAIFSRSLMLVICPMESLQRSHYWK